MQQQVFDRQAALKLAEKALRQGRINAAIEQYQQIARAQPRDWNSANALGDLYVRAGQVDRGIAEYTRIAENLAAEGFYPKAGALFKKILKIRKDDEKALIRAGEIAYMQGLLGDAKQAFQTVADNRRVRGDKRGVAEMRIRIGTLDPEDLEGRLSAARAAADIGDKATAFREFREVGAKFEELEQGGAALAAFQSAFELDGTDALIRDRLVKGYLAAGDVARARTVAQNATELKLIASTLESQGRHDEMLDVLSEIAAADPSDVTVRGSLATAFATRGDMDRAKSFLTPATAARNPALWLTLAEMELSRGRLTAGRAAVTHALELDPSQREAVVELGCRIAFNLPDAGYECVDVAANAALAEDDYGGAAAALHEFVTRVRNHTTALLRLVEICVDGGLESTMYEAQGQLADAYLEEGRGLEARVIGEDLIAREPWNRANVERYRKALVMLGEDDPDPIIADRLSGESPFQATDTLDLNEGTGFDEETARIASLSRREAVPIRDVVEPSTDEDVEAHEPGSDDVGTGFQDVPPSAAAPETRAETEVDLSDLLLDEEEPVAAPPSAARPRVLDEEGDEEASGPSESESAEQYKAALVFHDMGLLSSAMKSLEIAAHSPRHRFDAASLLGRIHLEQGRRERAVEWFERAAEAPAPTPDAARALLYDLGEVLESSGETARALAVFVELESESGGFRDVAGRIARLAKVQAEG